MAGTLYLRRALLCLLLYVEMFGQRRTNVVEISWQRHLLLFQVLSVNTEAQMLIISAESL